MKRNNELSCLISLCDSEKILFKIKDLMILDDFGAHFIEFSSHNLGFTYDEITGNINTSDEKVIIENLGKDCIYVDNVVEKLDSIYQQAIQEGADITKSKIFTAIKRYFISCLEELCKKQKIQFEQLYFIFIVPNEWSLKKNMLHLVLIPLLQHIGVTFSSNYLDDILYITQLEASLSSLQLEEKMGRRIPNVSRLLQDQNRCILFNMMFDREGIQQQSIYFQFKESYDLKIYNSRRFYIPKVISIEETHHDNFTIDFDYLQDRLNTLIFKQILNAENFCDIPVHGTHLNTENATVADVLMEELLQATIAFLEPEATYRQQGDFRAPFSVSNYINESQAALLFNSEVTLKKVVKELEQLLSKEIQKATHYSTCQSSKVPFFRKSIILNGYMEDYHIVPWFQAVLYTLFSCLLSKELKTRYQDNDPTEIYVMVDRNFFRERSIEGAALYASMKLMGLNMMLPPVIVKESKRLNRIGRPVYTLVHQPGNLESVPDVLVFIDISLNSTSITCELVNRDGISQKRFSVRVQENNEELSSIMLFLTNHYATSITHNQINNGDTLDFQEFRVSQVERLMLETKKSRFDSKLETLINKISRKERIVDRSTKTTKLQAYFADYIMNLVDLMDLYLSDNNITPGNVGYVLSTEKLIADNLLMESRTDLSDFVKRNTAIIFKRTQRNMVVVDQGEKEVHCMLQRSKLNPPAFYVHAHMEDSHIYLKLHQVVDTTNANGGISQQSTIFIKDRKILVIDIHKQVCEKLWSHIHSQSEQEKEDHTSSGDQTFNDFENFRKVMTLYIKEKVFLGSNLVDINRKHDIRISKCSVVTITAQQILQIAIIPVLKGLLSTIISSLTNIEIFGYYEITKILITGKFFVMKDFCEVYHYVVTTEMKGICQQLIRENTHRTKLDICISTSRESNFNSNSLGKKCFCYNVFLRGELRLVSPSTYFFRLSKPFLLPGKSHWLYCQIDTSIKCGFSSAVMLRGEELHNKTIYVMPVSMVSYNSGQHKRYFGSGFFKYSEPQSEEEMGNFFELRAVNFGFQFFGSPSTLISQIKIEILPYFSSIKITTEEWYTKPDGKITSMTQEHIIAERFTLKYF